MVVFKKIDVKSFAMFLMALYATLGLIIGVLVGLVGIFGGSLIFGGAFAGFGLLLVIVLPLVYGVLGFIIGAIMGLIINFALKITKGVKVELTSR